ncbi:MAG: patatin-like phospholipase family protein [Sphaerochaetaceae bacterium]|nr:patatin-like phospholipase family protein [Sphaerochaetaceae bacterium]
MKKLVLIILLVLVSLSSAFALDSSLSLSGTPIVYGEEDFIRRVEEKADGREPVGLVLTGGSARALAHIGVLKYMEENGIVPDFIIGNSMGSIVGLLYAYGLSPDQILDIFESVDIGTLFDLNLPVGRGLISTDRFINFLKLYLGEDLRLEDLKIPVIAVCEDLVSKRSILLCEGDFYDALLGSFALPVYFSSIEYGEHLLIDGAVANIAPVNFAYRYTDNVIVSTTFYSNPDLNLKNAITALNVSFDIGKRRKAMAEIAEHPEIVWIRCDVESFSFMQFSAGLELAQRGYNSCLEVAEELKAFASEAQMEDLNSFRAGKDEEIKSATKAFNVFSFAPSSETVVSYPVIEGKSFGRGQEKSYYRDDTALGTGVRLSSGNFTGVMTIGGAFSLDSENFYIKPVLSLDLTQYFARRFELNGNVSWYFNSSFSAVQTLRYVVDMPENFDLSVGEKFEAHSGESVIFSLFADAQYENKGLEAALCLEGGFEGKDLFVRVLPEVQYRIPGTSFSAAADAEVKSVKGSTTAEALLNVSYNFDKDFTFGEMFIFSGTKAGVYIVAGSEGPLVNEAGLSFETDMGLIGLRTIPVSLILGYQFDANAVHLAFETQL